MKLATVLFSLCALSASAFTVPRPFMAARLATTTTKTSLFSDKQEDEEGGGGGLDLDLGEMFEMFDAADKDEDFDKTIKKVKESTKKGD